jgi:glycosyltransferase involved in cell wall biosynthesis
MPPLRIAIDARLNGYRTGGIARYTQALLHALAECDRDNSYLVLEAARPRIKDRQPDGQSLGSLPPNFKRVKCLTPPHHRAERFLLAAETALLKLDVLHSPDFIPPFKLWPKHTRRVITIHDLNFLLFPQFQTADSLRYYRHGIEAAVRDADHILAVSRSARDDLLRLLNVPPERVTVQGEGVDPAFRPLSAEQVNPILSRYDLAPGYILFVGTLEPRKNILGLLQAYHLLRTRLSSAPPLVIVGKRGWLYEPILEGMAATDLGSLLKRLDLPAVYNGASVLALPSFYEGFGLPALEAMACGIPTVVSDRGALPEVIGDAGLLVDPNQPQSIADALERMLTDSALRQQAVEKGLRRAAASTWQKAAQTALQVYTNR